jgi:hypothetical protein
MSGEQESLRKALDRLQAQLDELRAVDPDVAAQLEATIHRARSAPAERGSQASEHHSLLEQLQDAVLEYEASHPTLAANLGAVIKALGQMGI